MVSDFFYPNTGGVEVHIYQLAQCLLARGHKVVVLTHAYGPRSGVRHMTGGLKVYYAPRVPVYSGATLPGLAGLAPLLRSILLRERIDIVHGHAAFRSYLGSPWRPCAAHAGLCSSMANEALLHARTLGAKAVFTDHSLFGFSDLSSILTNKTLQFTLADACEVICVRRAARPPQAAPHAPRSHTSKQNTVLRSNVAPERVSVIPNAVDASRFTPDPAGRQLDRTVVVCMNRLVYRKGVDLLVAAIPLVCAACPAVDFVIGGDGPKRAQLEAMVAAHGLGARVRLLGDVAHEDVRGVLRGGHIFLSASLTESFGIAVLEAACCGMLVVATAVGGVPEVLPPSIMRLSAPAPAALAAAVAQAAAAVAEATRGDPRAARQAWEQHRAVAAMYSWQDVAARVERVYARAAAAEGGLYERLLRYSRTGPFSGIIFCVVAAANALLMALLELWAPAASIDVAPDTHPGADAGFVRGG